MRRGAIILAGGQSSRMGQDKWRLVVGERTVLERIADALAGRVEEIWIVLPYGAEESLISDISQLVPGARIICDEEPDAGPLAGMEAGLRASSSDVNLVLAADMPFVKWAVADLLFQAAESEAVDAVVPIRRGRTHPLFAVYRKRALSSLEWYRRTGGRKVMEWVSQLSIVQLDDAVWEPVDAEEPTCFFNMNTPEDYAAARRVIAN